MKEVEWELEKEMVGVVGSKMMLTKIGGGVACPREQGRGRGEKEKEKEHLQWSEEMVNGTVLIMENYFGKITIWSMGTSGWVSWGLGGSGSMQVEGKSPWN